MSFTGNVVDWNDPSAPLWYKMGFSSEDAYNSAYGITNAAAPTTAPAPQTAPQSGLSASNTQYGYSNDDAFGQYLNENKDAATASGYITALLQKYNLQSLAPMVKNLIVGGTTNPDILTQKVMETPEFKTEYPEIEQRAAAGLAPLSPADIINTRSAYDSALSSVGVDPSFLSKEQKSDLIVKGVSAPEIQSRLTNMVGTIQKFENDPTLGPQFQRLYAQGITPGELAAYYMDPDHTEAYLTKQVTAAGLASRAQQTGFGQLNQGQAENLAGLGITDAQATQGFGQLAAERGLLDPLASENASISSDTAISAQFQNNAQAQQQLTRRLAERKGAFGGGGNFSDPNKTGLTGVGSANS